MPTSTSQLQKVRELIKTGKRQDAIRQLVRLIERDHENPELWWLLANASTDVKQQRQALDYLLSITPNDQRARQMLNRLEARQVLKQMGIHSTQPKAPVRRRRRGVLVFAVVGFAGVVIALSAIAANSRLFNPEPKALPTLVAMATDEPTHTPEVIPPTKTDLVMVPTVFSTEAPTMLSYQLPAYTTNPEATAEVAAPTEEPVITEQIIATEEQQPTEEAVIPTQTEITSPESTEDPLALLPTNGAGTIPVQETPFPVPSDPEATNEPFPTDGNGGLNASVANPTAFPDINTSSTTALPSPAVTGLPISDIRGQVLDGAERREIIAPYGEQGWQFSAFTGEKIVIELTNITGDGNPALELRREDGIIVAAAINTQNTGTKQARLEYTIADDSIYTVVVRMAAMTEQLYTLKLTRVP